VCIRYAIYTHLFGKATKGRLSAPRRAAGHLAEWLLTLRQAFSDRILPISDAVAIEWGRIAALRPRGDSDGLIATTAKVHDLILVSRNVTDFADTGLSIVNP
jgi:predicted nucleic acid-binding protein